MMKNIDNLLILRKQLHCVIAKNRAILSDDIFLLAGHKTCLHATRITLSSL